MRIPPFVQELAKRMGKKTIKSIPRRTMKVLQGYAWPGNVRELKNIVERAMITSPGPGLTIDASALSGSASFRAITLDEVQRRHILEIEPPGSPA